MSDNVRLLVFNREGCILVVAEVDDPLVFKLPGGNIESGESPEGAALRELQEELSIIPVTPLALIGWHPTRSGDRTYVYATAFEPKDIKFGAEIATHTWVDPKRIPEDWPRREYITKALGKLAT